MCKLLKRLFRRTKTEERVVPTKVQVQKVGVLLPNHELACALKEARLHGEFRKEYKLVNSFITKLMDFNAIDTYGEHLLDIENNQYTEEIKSFARRFKNLQIKCTNNNINAFVDRVMESLN